jgi:hypothetical protein
VVGVPVTGRTLKGFNAEQLMALLPFNALLLFHTLQRAKPPEKIGPSSDSV